jgi:hypothetical protein
MTFTLYKTYTLAEIQGTLHATPVAGYRYFLRLNGAIICIADIEDKSPFSFGTPRELRWKPPQGTINDSNGRMADELDAVYRAETLSKFLFAAQNDVTFIYLGELDFGGVTRDSDSLLFARWELQPKLPRELWMQLGSFGDWRLTINGRELLLCQDSNLSTTIENYWSNEVVEIYLTRYEGDVLHLVANGDAAFIWYTDEMHTIGLKSINRSYTGDDERIAYFHGFHPHDWDVPERIVIRKSEAYDILMAYFRSGSPSGLLVESA